MVKRAGTTDEAAIDGENTDSRDGEQEAKSEDDENPNGDNMDVDQWEMDEEMTDIANRMLGHSLWLQNYISYIFRGEDLK